MKKFQCCLLCNPVTSKGFNYYKINIILNKVNALNVQLRSIILIRSLPAKTT